VRLLLVRHGETEGNVSRRLQGADDPLTERGSRQADELAKHLSGRGDIVALYASPYSRALETARAIGGRLGMEPVLRAGLAEIDVGDAVGYRFEEWTEKYPEEAERFRIEGLSYTWPGGESGLDLSARTEAEIDAIVAEHRSDEGAVIVVSHGGALAWIIAHLLGESDDEWPYEYARLDNCSITEAEIGPDSTTHLFYTNEVGHLSPDPEEEIATGHEP
jgi:probable phosphoglycerate mutase